MTKFITGYEEFDGWWMLQSKITSLELITVARIAYYAGKTAAKKDISDMWDSNDLITAEQATDQIKI